MQTSQMLNKMCHEVLSAADIKAICKSRGFSAQEAKSKASFENFWPSDIGVPEAMKLLSQDEIILLHLLKRQDEPVDLTFFRALYDPASKDSWRYSRTFTQRYQTTFKKVRQSLVRRGLLLMAEDSRVSAGKSKMERWRFQFPQAFEKFLPPPFAEIKTFDTPGNFNETLVRGKLLELMGERSSSIRLRGGEYNLHLKNGQLYFGKYRFQMISLVAWQQAEWAFTIKAGKKSQYVWLDEYKMEPLDAISYGLSQLQAHQWVSAAEIEALLKIFCESDKTLDVGALCRTGWQWGRLVKQTEGWTDYYRLPDEKMLAGTELDPARYLHCNADQTVGLNLHTIPYQSLEYLSRIADLRVKDAQLSAAPNLVKMGRVRGDIRQHPLTLWLEKESPSFKNALKMFDRRWGKQIVHQDLMIAKVKDLSLKIAIQKAIKDPSQIVFLPDDYIAFPCKLNKKIENLVSTSGHVIKRVQSK